MDSRQPSDREIAAFLNGIDHHLQQSPKDRQMGPAEDAISYGHPGVNYGYEDVPPSHKPKATQNYLDATDGFWPLPERKIISDRNDAFRRISRGQQPQDPNRTLADECQIPQDSAENADQPTVAIPVPLDQEDIRPHAAGRWASLLSWMIILSPLAVAIVLMFLLRLPYVAGKPIGTILVLLTGLAMSGEGSIGRLRFCYDLYSSEKMSGPNDGRSSEQLTHALGAFEHYGKVLVWLIGAADFAYMLGVLAF